MDIRETINKLMGEDYRAFIKALISIEKDIIEEDQLDYLYEEYMKRDNFTLLSENFDKLISNLKNKDN